MVCSRSYVQAGLVFLTANRVPTALHIGRSVRAHSWPQIFVTELGRGVFLARVSTVRIPAAFIGSCCAAVSPAVGGLSSVA